MPSKAKELIINTKQEDIGIKWITQNFGNRVDPTTKQFLKPKYKTTEKIILRAGEYINKKEESTNIGILLFNKLLVENILEEIIPNGYYNHVMTASQFDQFLDIIANAILHDKITNERVDKFISHYEFFGLKLTAIFSPSFTMNIIKPNEKVMKEKERLLKETPDLTNLKTQVDIENKLVDLARNELKNDPGIALFDSGARGKFDDNYKIMSIMVGPTKNLITGEFDLMESNYVDGIKKEDIRTAGDSVILASYPKAVGTADSGYITKQFYAVFQSMTIEDGDCGTNEGLTVFLTKENVKRYLFQNVITGDHTYETLTEDTVENYLGKTIRLRSPMFCTSHKICRVCAGERYHQLNIKNMGLTFSTLPNGILNAGMKQFHSSKVKLNRVDPNNLLI